MSQYNPVTPTIQGQAMIAESLKTETGLVFTKVEWGDGIVSRGEQYQTFTALKNKVIESPISKMERQDATLYITSVVNNSTLSTGFYCREIGVWAKIGANGTEQLFAYTYAENASYTPSSNQYNEKRVRIGLGVDANVNVTIKFNSEVYLTRQELEDHDADSAAHDAAFTAHNTDTTAHPDIRQMISQKADKTGIGASGTWGIDISGNAATATKLSTARTIQTNLASTSSASFDGTADATPGVTGILPVANGGTGQSNLGNVTVFGASALNSWTYRPTTANITFADAKVRYYLATNSMTTAKPPHEGAILHLPWDNSTWDSQLCVGTDGSVATRSQNNSWDWSKTTGWKLLAFAADVPKNNGTGATGTWDINISGTATKATQDGNGANIADTYLNKAGDTVTGVLNVPTQPTTDNSTKVANTAFVQSAVSKIVNSAPETLDTLNELATALGNDPNFATTVSTQIGQKADKTELNNSLARHNADVTAHNGIINTVPRISIIKGFCWDGQTIPLPDGYTESQCTIFVSISTENPNGYWYDVAESGAKNMLKVDCYTEGRTLRCAMTYAGFDGWRTGNNSGDNVGNIISCAANYLVIGIKYGG